MFKYSQNEANRKLDIPANIPNLSFYEDQPSQAEISESGWPVYCERPPRTSSTCLPQELQEQSGVQAILHTSVDSFLRTEDSRLQAQREGVINTIAVITSGCISSPPWSASYYLSAQFNNAWRPTEWLKNSNRSSIVLFCQSVGNNCWLMEINYLYLIP